MKNILNIKKIINMLSNLIFINTNRSYFDGFFNDIFQKLLIVCLALMGLIKICRSTNLIRVFLSKVLENDNIKNIIVDSDFMKELQSKTKNVRKSTRPSKVNGKKNLTKIIDEFSEDDEFVNQEVSLNKKSCCGKCCASRDRSKI